MALSREEKKARKRTLLIIVGVVVLFVAMQSKSLVQAIVAPSPPGYDKTKPAGDYTPLDWDTLQKGAWTYGSKPRLAEGMAALEGKPVTVRGYMLPLHSAAVGGQWFFASKPRGCYFCNPPGISDVIEINMPKSKEIEPSTWQVDVYGTFHMAQGKPSDALLYWIDDAVVVVAF